VRLPLVLVVARKDLDDVLSSRLLMATIVLLPFIFAVVIPVVTLVPLSELPSRSAPLSLTVVPERTYDDRVLSNGLIENATLDQCRLVNMTLVQDVVGNSTLNNSYAVESVLWNVTLNDSVVKDSNLYVSHVDTRSILIDSVQVGQPSELQRTAEAVLGFYLIFFLLIPVIIPATMASYTIVGEKTNRSLEPLLASPLSSSELLTGKTLAILLPTVAATWGSFAAFSFLITAGLDHLTGSSPVPNATWYLAVLVVAPLVGLLSIALNVIVSARVSDVRVAQQLGSLVIFPILVFFLGGLFGVFSLSPVAILLLAALVGVAAVVSLAMAVKLFDRETVLLRWK
jgi:ABC-type Na+ efflux pump permease subunit